MREKERERGGGEKRRGSLGRGISGDGVVDLRSDAAARFWSGAPAMVMMMMTSGFWILSPKWTIGVAFQVFFF